MSDQNTPAEESSAAEQPRHVAPAPTQWRTGAGGTASSAAPAASRGWWGEATSTGGGRAALIGVAVLGVLVLVTGLGLATALALGHARWGDDRGLVTSSRDEVGPRMGPGMGNGKGKGKRNGPGNNGNGRGGDVPGNPANPGLGMGRGGGAAGLGAALHGEFTTNATGTPTVMVVQTGQVTAYTAGKSLTVKSTDGYEATYTLDGTTATSGRGGAQLATGVQVRVLAVKDGMVVTSLVVGG